MIHHSKISDVTGFSVTTCYQLQQQVGGCICGILMSLLVVNCLRSVYGKSVLNVSILKNRAGKMKLEFLENPRSTFALIFKNIQLIPSSFLGFSGNSLLVLAGFGKKSSY